MSMKKASRIKRRGKSTMWQGGILRQRSFMQGTVIRSAFVSTNSITQGEQVAGVWKPLHERFGVHIDFAHRSFIWDSEASMKAHVHCVIVGFSAAPNEAPKRIFMAERFQIVENINAYLIDAPDVFIESRKKALCDIPEMIYGNKPTDGGFLFLTPEEYQKAVEAEPQLTKYIRRVYGASEYINNKVRYCIVACRSISSGAAEIKIYYGTSQFSSEV